MDRPPPQGGGGGNPFGKDANEDWEEAWDSDEGEEPEEMESGVEYNVEEKETDFEDDPVVRSSSRSYSSRGPFGKDEGI